MRATFRHAAVGALTALSLTSCVTHNQAGGDTPEELTIALTAMSPKVSRAEAQRAARTIYLTSARLKQEYKIGNSAHWQNLLIGLGAKKKGYCYHWAEDILAALRPLRLQTLDIHWAIADPGKDTESNALVLTAKRHESTTIPFSSVSRFAV
ncbi:MAG TPA: hypothetical protein VG095_02270, partial [Chthoniobacterales bacterium]|nr:hypothetical protein [Chthoniobacterales bacterium]